MVAEDGGVVAIGARFRGSLPGLGLQFRDLFAPVNGMTAFGAGTLLVGGDGGVFTLSELPFAGSAVDFVDSDVAGLVPLVATG
jgi:hypothetical protein